MSDSVSVVIPVGTWISVESWEGTRRVFDVRPRFCGESETSGVSSIAVAFLLRVLRGAMTDGVRLVPVSVSPSLVSPKCCLGLLPERVVRMLSLAGKT